MTNWVKVTPHSQRLTVYAVAAVFIILCVLLIIPSWREDSVNSLRERRTVYNDIDEDIGDVRSSLLEMRLATRGFLISKNSIFRQEYDQAHERLQAASTSLRAHIALQTDGVLAADTANLEEQILEWRQQHLEYQLAMVENGDLTAAQSDFAQDTTRQKYDDIRTTIAEMRSRVHLHESEIRDVISRFSNQVIFINSSLVFLALVAVVLVSVGFYRQIRLNTALISAETAAHALSETLAARLSELQALNSRLESGQRVVNMLPRLQQAEDPLSLLAHSIRSEYNIPAVFFWMNESLENCIPLTCVASVDDALSSLPLPAYQELSGSEFVLTNWGGLQLEYRSLEVSGNVLGCMAVAVVQEQIHESIERQQVALIIENIALFRQLKSDDELLSTVFESAPLGFVLLGLHGEALIANSRAAILLPGVARGADMQTICAAGMYYALGGKPFPHTELPLIHALNNYSSKQIELIHEIAGVRIPVRHEVISVAQTGYLLVMEDMRPFHELERLKTDFVSMISHELRTPLAAIVAATDMLQSNKTHHRGDTEATIEIIRQQGSRLDVLIKDILNLSRLESDGVTLDREPIDAIVLVNKVINRDQIWKSRCTVTVIASHALYVDVGRIEQVLANILQNAVKYALQSPIEIQIGPLNPATGNLLLAVRDFGIPLATSAYARVFDRFYQAHHHASSGGVGLGLAICKYFVEAHGGSIWMHAAPQNDGSVVSLELPIAASGTMATHVHIPSFHALIIEDDVLLPRMMSDAFADIHGTCEVVTSVHDALERAERRHFDVILVDLRLPDLSGLDFVRSVRDWLATPIIMMTASGNEHDLHDALRLGVDDYVVKPFSPTEIDLRVQNVMLRKRAIVTPSPQLRVGNVVAFMQAKTIEVDEEKVDITPIEFRLYALFAKHLGQVISHERILTEVWGDRYDQATQYVWVHVSHLRRKLIAAGAIGLRIETVRGVGYRLVVLV
jgi:DNA-binding response OmpR family regulator/signal transduction histidine kinase/CHASE3 domain sensor protein